MFYKFIDIPNLTPLQSDVLAFVKGPEYNLEPNETHSIRFKELWHTVPSVVRAVETVCEWHNVKYIAFATTAPRNFGVNPHQDSKTDDVEFPWALNIPIANWRQTYVNFYSARDQAQGITRGYGQGQYQYACTSYDQHDIELVETVCLDRPAFFNTRAIHSPVNFTAKARHIISVRFNIDLRQCNFGLM